MLQRNAFFSDSLHEILVEFFCVGRVSCINEAWAVAPFGIGIKRKLAYEQNASGNVPYGKVGLSVLIFKEPGIQHFFHHLVCNRLGIGVFHTQ